MNDEWYENFFLCDKFKEESRYAWKFICKIRTVGLGDL